MIRSLSCKYVLVEKIVKRQKDLKIYGCSLATELWAMAVLSIGQWFIRKKKVLLCVMIDSR